MQSGYTGHIVPAEWRWVIVVATLLVLVAFAPFLWITISGTSGTPWQFMGALHNYPDGAAYLSKMQQVRIGQVLVFFQHTPEPHNGMFMQGLYLLLGQLARLLSLSPIIMFHVARVSAALIMYLAIYQLAASVWMRVRTRRLFFVLATLGAGFGWLFGSLAENTHYPDLSIAEMFPFQATLENVHFPLGLACLALMVSVVITAFRLDISEDPNIKNGGLAAGLLSIVLVLIYPEAYVVFIAALGAYVVMYSINQRQMVMWAVRWFLVMLLPALPMLIFYGVFLTHNTAMAEWYQQKVTPAPNLIMLIIGLGIPLVLGLPGMYRAVRRFEPDGDQFMLVWLVVILVAMYLPTNFQQRFSAGLMLPVAYFAARSLEDFWFQYVSRPWRLRLFVMFVPLMLLSHLIVLFAPIGPLLARNPDGISGLFLERAYAGAFQWVDSHARSTDVVLTSPNVGLWLPAWANTHVVYGHPNETLDAQTKRQTVIDWYRLDAGNECAELLLKYQVRYVIVGPQELKLGSAACVSQLTYAIGFGTVDIYVVTR